MEEECKITDGIANLELSEVEEILAYSAICFLGPRIEEIEYLPKTCLVCLRR
jgi:hypothetical protein